MPELPEVETVRRGLAPYLTGARLAKVHLNRADLRFPFPIQFATRLQGARIAHVGRRAKYLLFALDSGEHWLTHLGMTGTFRFADFAYKEPSRSYEPGDAPRHDHAVFSLDHPEHGASTLIYADVRRFGFMDLVADPALSPYLAGLGPEPLGKDFNAAGLAARLKGRAPIKTALLDQRVVAGLGNIYVSEALYRAHILPTTPAGALVTAAGAPTDPLEALVAAIRAVLAEALAAGGATLRDFRNAQGETGYFQHRFAVYDRAGAPCPTTGCIGIVARMMQAGRSSFFCPVCQR